MFTLSMRPSASTKPTNLCVNFEQEAGGWKMSTFSDDPTQGNAFGLCFYSPLETVDITTEQLGDMIAGLEGAYDMLANNIFKQSDSIISKTPFGTVDMFMQCIPRGIFEEQPDESSIRATPGAKAAIPVMLVSKDLGRVIVYDGQHWSMDESPADIDTYNPGGMCYGWGVCSRASTPMQRCSSRTWSLRNEEVYCTLCSTGTLPLIGGLHGPYGEVW